MALIFQKKKETKATKITNKLKKLAKIKPTEDPKTIKATAKEYAEIKRKLEKQLNWKISLPENGTYQKESEKTKLSGEHLFRKGKKTIGEKIALIYASPVTNTLENLWMGKKYEDIKQPLLGVIRTTHNIDIFEDVRDGYFELDKSRKKKGETEQEEKIKGLILDNAKLLNLPAGEDKNGKPRNIKLWLGYEDEAITYPTDRIHDSNILALYIEQMMLNFDLLRDTGISEWSKYLKYVAIALVIGYLAYKMGWLGQLGNLGHATAEIAKNTTNLTATIPEQITQGAVTIG